MPNNYSKLPITILLATKNEAVNLPRCLDALRMAERIVVLDSESTDATVEIALAYDAEVVQFKYKGGYPKKRQWGLENLTIETPWFFLLDADEVITEVLWDDIAAAIHGSENYDAFFVRKGFHFLGRRMNFGGFSHMAVLLVRTGKGRFEQLLSDSANSLDMEIHERLVVQGRIGRLKTPLIHEDFKGLEAYIFRHNKYSTWEAQVRYRYLTTGRYGEDTIQPGFFGNSQERRRWIKTIVIRIPFEHHLWFLYHYFFRLGFLEGQAGLIASRIRSSYISQTRSKMYELRLQSGSQGNV